LARFTNIGWEERGKNWTLRTHREIYTRKYLKLGKTTVVRSLTMGGKKGVGRGGREKAGLSPSPRTIKNFTGGENWDQGGRNGSYLGWGGGGGGGGGLFCVWGGVGGFWVCFLGGVGVCGGGVVGGGGGFLGWFLVCG